MKINIEATLTNEQALILAKEKWYSELISTQIEKEIETEVDWKIIISTQLVNENISNTENPFEFLKRVYENMIASDATRHFLEIENRTAREKQLETERLIRDNIVSSIKSSVE